MCEALKELFADDFKESELKGRNAGRIEGRIEGRTEGRKAGRIEWNWFGKINRFAFYFLFKGG